MFQSIGRFLAQLAYQEAEQGAQDELKRLVAQGQDRYRDAVMGDHPNGIYGQVIQAHLEDEAHKHASERLDQQGVTAEQASRNDPVSRAGQVLAERRHNGAKS